MLRKIIDYKKLDHEIAGLLIETYPDGYGDDDIIMFKNRDGEIVEAVEIKTQEVIYLIKISKSLANFISNFEDNLEKELEKDFPFDDFELPTDESGIDLNPEEEEARHEM